MVNGDELTKGIPQSWSVIDVDAEIENAVKRVAVMTTIQARHSRPQAASEDFVYPCRLGELRVNLPADSVNTHEQIGVVISTNGGWPAKHDF